MPRGKTVSTVVDLDDENSIGSVGLEGKVVPAVSKRKTGQSRPSYDEAQHCPHCDGRMHMNLPAPTINFECLWRQFAISKGLIQHPGERLPVFAASDLNEMAEWAESRGRSRKNPLAYGKMAAPGGAATSYAALKSGKSVTQVAEEVEVPKKRGRPAKSVATASVAPVVAKPKVGRPPKVAASVAPAVPRNKQLTDDDLLDFGDDLVTPAKKTKVSNGKAQIKSPKKSSTPVVAAPEPKKVPRVKLGTGKATPATAGAKSAKALSPTAAKNGTKRRAVLARR